MSPEDPSQNRADAAQNANPRSCALSPEEARGYVYGVVEFLLEGTGDEVSKAAAKATSCVSYSANGQIRAVLKPRHVSLLEEDLQGEFFRPVVVYGKEIDAAERSLIDNGIPYEVSNHRIRHFNNFLNMPILQKLPRIQRGLRRLVLRWSTAS